MNFADRNGLINYLKSHRLWLRKESGQHILVEPSVLTTIIKAAELNLDDRVLEIGPGVGTLTEALADAVPQGLVLAVEKDYRLVALLRTAFKNRKNIKIVHADALVLLSQFKRQKSKVKRPGPDSKLCNKMVANLPYNITGPILRYLFDPTFQASSFTLLVLMLQREVVDRLLAPPGSSARGMLTILRELFGAAEKVIDVPKDAFFPVPVVDSAVIRINHTALYDEETAGKIIWLAKLGFAAKRQTLTNSLAAGLHRPKDEIRTLLYKAKIDHRARAEDLALADWLSLAQSISI